MGDLMPTVFSPAQMASDVLAGAMSWTSPSSAIGNVTGFFSPAAGQAAPSLGVFLGTVAVPLVVLLVIASRSGGRRR